MTLWIAWSALISALIAIAAAASAQAATYFRAPRRFMWMGAMIASTVTSLGLAFRTGPAITASSPAQLRTVTPSLSTGRVTSGDTIGSDRTTIPHPQSSAHVGVDSPIASSGSLSGGVGRWARWRHAIRTDIANVQRADAWIARAWALTSLILLLAFVRASVVLSRQRSQWRDVETEAGHVLVARDAGPAVVGFVHPRIVIPEWALSIERETRDLLLHHELEHIRAGDSRALLGAEMLLICAPWNAALWWMARQLRLAIEIDCDARVIRAGGRTREYALVLLAVGERYASAIPLAASLSEPRSNLEARIDAMTAPRLRRPVVASLPFVAFALAVLTTSAWMPRPMPFLIGRGGVHKEPVARTVRDESQGIANANRLVAQDVGDAMRSRVPDASAAVLSATHRNAQMTVDGQPATEAHPIDPARIPVAVEPAAARTSETQPLPGNPVPRYPESLRDAHIEGVVFVAFSTDARGVPDTTTIKIIASTNDLFTAEVRNVLPEWRLVASRSARLVFRFVMERGEPHFDYGSIASARDSTIGTKLNYRLTNRDPGPFVFDGLDFVPVLITGVAPSITQPRKPTWRPSWFFQLDLGHPLVARDAGPVVGDKPTNPPPRYPDAQSVPTSQRPSPETATVASRDPLSVVVALPSVVPGQAGECDKKNETEVRSLHFEGNRTFDSDQLSARVHTTSSSFTRRHFKFGAKRCYPDVGLKPDVDALKSVYQNNGFYKTTVDTIVRPVAPKTVDVTFRINEGEPLRIDSLTIAGLDSVPDPKSIVNDLQMKVGGRFGLLLLFTDMDSINARLRNAGYPQADIHKSYRTHPDQLRAEVDLEVTTGPRTRSRRSTFR
jgi:beta-lactamase regulating signal transducer with metallopeptidase domain